MCAKNHGVIPSYGKKIISSPVSPDQLWGQGSFPFWLNRDSLQGVKEPEHEVSLSPPSSVKFKNAWHCQNSPPYDFMLCNFPLLSAAQRAA
jgi:hypothetical protein